MFNICSNCGEYHVDKIIEPKGPYAKCPSCGHPHQFKQLPLFIITGASGVGKTSVCRELANTSTQTIAIESDILWRNEFNCPDNDYREYREMWLRLCKNISQAGKPVVLCGSAVPSQFEDCNERRYFSQLYYLALTCNDDLLKERLKKRPSLRNCNSDEFINGHIQFNNWFIKNAEKSLPQITLLDTSHDSIKTSVENIINWISERI